MTNERKRNPYWNESRVLAGLRLAARELYNDAPGLLPYSLKQYADDVRAHDHRKEGPRRRYPPAHRVPQHFPSMTHVWHALGFLNEEQTREYMGSYWTRGKMIEAGADFFRRQGFAPTNDGWWNEATKYQLRDDLPGVVSYYPSYATLHRVGGWPGMRDFWRAVREAHPELRIPDDRADLPWLPLEEWFVVESCGILPRHEIARLMRESGYGRTEAAIKRRLYDLGVDSRERWGWTTGRSAQAMGLRPEVIREYMLRGELPYFRGSRNIFLDPADLLVVGEYNWAKKRHPKTLDRAVRRSLALRVCFALLGHDWRRVRPHQPRPAAEYWEGGRVCRRKLNSSRPPEPRPKHIRVGSRVKITGEWARRTPGARERVGRVSSIYWSPVPVEGTLKIPPRPACWVAKVELPPRPGRKHLQYRRKIYCVPAASLERAQTRGS